MKYYVTLKYEETIEVEVDSEAEAIKQAIQYFDPITDEPEVVEVWSDEDD